MCGRGLETEFCMKAGMLILPVTPHIGIGLLTENSYNYDVFYRIKMTILAGRNQVMYFADDNARHPWTSETFCIIQEMPH